MRDKVIVDGITLTRAEIERAQRELNAPEFVPGDIVRSKHGTVALVIGGSNNLVFNEYYNSLTPCSDGERFVDGKISYSPSSFREWIKVGSLNDFREK